MERLARTMVGVMAVLALVVTGALAETKVNPKDQATMVWIPEGEFLMGSDKAKDCREDEQPQRKVYLDGYWIYQCEVTVAQFRRFCKATGTECYWEGRKPDYGWQDNFPMVNVNWDESRAYCQWAGGDLPTEAQWEKAARGTDGRIYPWGDEWNPRWCVNSVGNTRSSPVEVGTYERKRGVSPYGIYDMAGNAWEWCRDWYGLYYYDSAPDRNPTGPTEGEARVARGGSWSTTDTCYFRCACRSCLTSDDGDVNAGFRCVQGR